MMQPFSIKGFQGTSLIDYPGRIASIIYTGSCNFRCRFCYNRALVEDAASLPDIPADEMLAALEKRRNFIEGVVVTGGEPTLQPGLIDFLKELKKLGLAVKLDTNGSRPDAIESAIADGLAEYIAMDYKAPLAKLERVCGAAGHAENVARSARLLIERAPRYEFRTTVHPLIIDFRDLETIAAELAGARAWFLQQYHAFDSLDPLLMESKPYPKEFFERAEMMFGPMFEKFAVRNL